MPLPYNGGGEKKALFAREAIIILNRMLQLYFTYLFIYLFIYFYSFFCFLHPDPCSYLPIHPIPLGLPSAPGLSTCLMHPTWAGDLFHPR